MRMKYIKKTGFIGLVFILIVSIPCHSWPVVITAQIQVFLRPLFPKMEREFSKTTRSFREQYLGGYFIG
jgi:hypothetical protein